MRAVLTDLIELVLPADCPGCGAPGPAAPMCPTCAGALAALTPHPTVPDPPPPGLPPCRALGAYQGMLRELILAYKERGRLGLAGPLGRALAVAVAGAVPAGAPVTLVPVPATAAAARSRGGDHVLRLARVAARRFARGGRVVSVRRLLVARPRRADSTELTAADRIARAEHAFRCRQVPQRRSRAGPVVLVDDLVTTGATLAGAAGSLRRAGVPVTAAATLAATRRRR